MKRVSCPALVIIFADLSFLAYIINGQINETTVIDQKDGNNSSITELERICAQIDHCQEVYNVTKSFNDLRTRNCMCDENCSIYGDCCSDSKYLNGSKLVTEHRFSCVNTTLDGDIYVVNSCASDWGQNESAIIRTKCHSDNELAPFNDVLSLVPVTSKVNNITYKNLFCAMCNGEANYEFWSVNLEYKLYAQNVKILVGLDRASLYSTINNTIYEVVNSPQDSQSILSHLKVNQNEPYLTSEFKGLIYSCVMQPKVPSHLLYSVRYCLRPDNSSTGRCSECNRNTVGGSSISNSSIDSISNINNSSEIKLNGPSTSTSISTCKWVNSSEESLGNFIHVSATNVILPRGNVCKDIIGLDIHGIFCPSNSSSSPSPPPQSKEYVDKCFLSTLDGKECLVNSYFTNGTDFRYVNNETVYLYKFKAEFGFDEWAEQDETRIYVCGTEIPRTNFQKIVSDINNVITEVGIKFSIFFLVVHILTVFFGNNLQSLANKIILSYCITLLVVYSVFESTQWLSSCKIVAAVLHYLFLSCFCWLLVASYDFWLVVCRTSAKFQSLAGKTRLKRYLLYCFVGWISPLFIMAPSIYFELSANDVIRCDLKPGYGRLKQCFIAQEAASYYFFYIPTTIIFCSNIALFSHTSFHLYSSKRKGIKSTAQNNYYVLFTKLALTMGLTWAIGLLVTFTDFLIFRIIYCIFNASQGTFMYFAFGFQKKAFLKCFEGPKDGGGGVMQRTKSTYMAFTDMIKGKSHTSGAESSTQIED